MPTTSRNTVSRRTALGLPVSTRQNFGLPDQFGVCRAALLGDNVIEGPVQAQERRRLVKAKLHLLEIAVPCLVVGCPSMEVGRKRDAFNVLLVLKDGRSCIYQSYPSTQSAKEIL